MKKIMEQKLKDIFIQKKQEKIISTINSEKKIQKR